MYSPNWSEMMYFGQENQKNDAVSLSVHHIWVFMILICLTAGDVYLDHLDNVMIARFLHCKVTFLYHCS